MICYIKDKKTFVTKSALTVLDYELHESIYDTVSKVVIPTPDSPPEEGDFLMFDGQSFVGILSGVEIDEGETELSVQQAVNLLGRNMFYSAASYTYLEDYLKDLIDTNYTECTDEVYEIPFLEVNALSHTNKNCKPDLEDNVFSIKNYISKLRRLQGIVCDWGFSRTALKVNISKKTFPLYNIDMSDPRYKILEQTFSGKTIGKITAYCEEDGNYYTRYLKTDGSVSSTKPAAADRVEGEWITLKVSKAEDIADKVEDEFAKNYYSHKVTFSTDRDFSLYDRLVLRIEGKIFSSYVSGVIREKGSEMRTVECGELQTVYPYLERL